MPVHIGTSVFELNLEEVTALARHKPPFCAVGDHLLHLVKKHLKQRSKNTTAMQC